MIFQKLKYTIVILFILIFGLLALPQFHINVGDKIIEFPDINLSLLDPNSKLGNFKRSIGLYPSKEVKATIDFGTVPIDQNTKESILTQYIDVITQRINYAGLTDLKVRGEHNNTDYSIVITYPDYYTDTITFTQWLTAQGKISFVNESGDTLNPLNIHDYDIEGSIGIDYLEQVGNHLTFKIKVEKATELANALRSSSNNAIIMSIDGNPLYVIIAHNTLSYYVRAIANVPEINKNSLLYITRTYFLTNTPLEFKMNVAETETNVTAIYATDGGSILGLAFILSAVILFVSAASVYKFKGAIAFSVMLASYLAFIIVILKLLSATLSIATVAGFIISYIIGVIVIWNLLKKNPEDNKNEFDKYLLFSALILIISIVIYKLMPNLYIFNDFIGVMIIASISLVLMIAFNFRELLKMYYL